MDNISIHDAAQSGNLAVVRALLDSGVAVDAAGFTACSDRDSTALHIAAEAGHLAIVELLLEKGASTQLCNLWGHTAAHLAAQDGQIEVLQSLLKHDASVVSAVDDIDRTPLHLAAQNGHVTCVEALLAAGAAVDPRAASAEPAQYSPVTSAVHAAAAADQLECLLALLEHGDAALVDLRDGFGRTPLHVAATGGHTRCVEALVKRGAMLDAVCAWGSTPLHVATRGRHLAAVDVILDHGAGVSKPDASGTTPLHLAAAAGCDTTVGRLLLSGADVDALNAARRTPLFFAVDADNVAIVLALLAKGASLRALEQLDWAAPHVSACAKAAVRDFVRQRSLHCAMCWSSTLAGRRRMRENEVGDEVCADVLPQLPVEVQERVMASVFGVDLVFYSQLLELNTAAGGRRAC